jgi:hypothetical protein
MNSDQMPSDGELSLCTARATDCLLSQRNADLLVQEMGNILEKVPLPLADVSNGVMKQLFYYAACKCLGSKQGLLPVPGTILLRKYREVDGRKRRDDPDARFWQTRPRRQIRTGPKAHKLHIGRNTPSSYTHTALSSILIFWQTTQSN